MLIQKPLTIMCTNNSLKIPIKFNQHLSYSVSKQKKKCECYILDFITVYSFYFLTTQCVCDKSHSQIDVLFSNVLLTSLSQFVIIRYVDIVQMCKHPFPFS